MTKVTPDDDSNRRKSNRKSDNTNPRTSDNANPRKSENGKGRKSKKSTGGEESETDSSKKSHKSHPSRRDQVAPAPMEEIKSRKEQRKERRLVKKTTTSQELPGGRESVRSSFLAPPKEIIIPAPWAPPSSASAKGGNAGKFIQCNTLTVLMLVAYILALMITGLAVYCYREDALWNSVVKSERPFPKIEGEDYFGGKYLHLRDDIHHSFDDAKEHMLREDQIFELLHLIFMVVFIIVTSFQIVAYITRGDEDHSRIIIGYYTAFGGLALIVAIFPLLSWRSQDKNYDTTVIYFEKFNTAVQKGSINETNGTTETGDKITSVTIHDILILEQIMKFCYNASQNGVTFTPDNSRLSLFGKNYELKDFQRLGFCTNHKFKITNTVMTIVFALLCCTIPCIYCVTASTGWTSMIRTKQKLAEKAAVAQASRQREESQPPILPPPPLDVPPPPPEVHPSPREEPSPPPDASPPPAELPSPPPQEIALPETAGEIGVPREVPPSRGMDEEEARRERREKRRQQRVRSLDGLSQYERDIVENFRLYVENEDELDAL